MKKVKKLWIPVFLGLLLPATLIGVAGARPEARAEAQRQWRVITVPTSACIAIDETDDYHHFGNALQCQSGLCEFLCPVYFPAAGEQAAGAVTVKRVTMYAFDNASGQYAWFAMHRTFPRYGNTRQMTTAQTVDSTDNPQRVMATRFSYNPVLRTQGPYLRLAISPPGLVEVFGFEIHYTW